MQRLAKAVLRVEAKAPPEQAASFNPLTEVKLWENPCWFSYRLNYLALHYNIPIYDWIERRYGLARPEYMVLYSIGLKSGVAAKDICISSGFPKNTISRAVQGLLKRKLIRRAQDEADLRSFVLRLTRAGRDIFDETLPTLVGHERRMLSSLSAAEQALLSELLAKLVMQSPDWPSAIAVEGES